MVAFRQDARWAGSLKPLVTFAQAQRLDQSTKDAYGLSDDQLMEAAAIGMARALESDEVFSGALEAALHDTAPVQVVALCGGGNNGGDALAVLRHLAFSGRTGLVAVVAARHGATMARRLAEAEKTGVTVLAPEDPRAQSAVARAGLVLDGCSGIGFKGPLRGELAGQVRLAALANGPVVAMDVPSGLGPLFSPESDPDSPVKASATLCVEPCKGELYFQGNRESAGRIIPVPGVFPRPAGLGPGMALLEAPDLTDCLPAPGADSHKGDRGALGVFAGAVGSTGAAVLCARAASAAGAGSVTLLVRDTLVPIVSALVVSQMVRPASAPGARRFAAVVAGPGWGTDDANVRTLGELWDAALPLVLDADALRLLAARPKVSRCSPLILTPHPGEFAPLAALAAGANPADPEALEKASRRIRYDTASTLTEVAAHFGAVVILKGSVTWTGDPDGRLAVWDGREPTLATAGSGDVLAGLAGGFLARGSSAWNAATAAVLTHGLAGKACAAKGFYEAEALLGEAALLSYRRNTDGNQG